MAWFLKHINDPLIAAFGDTWGVVVFWGGVLLALVVILMGPGIGVGWLIWGRGRKRELRRIPGTPDGMRVTRLRSGYEYIGTLTLSCLIAVTESIPEPSESVKERIAEVKRLNALKAIPRDQREDAANNGA